MQPLLYFSYGMTKTGSTLAFELARTALDLCGYPQDRLGLDVIKPDAEINFVNFVSEPQIIELKTVALAQAQRFALKTHHRPDPAVVAMIRRGEATAQISYRDPRDMALSMLDHAARARETGRQSFSEFYTLDDALENIRQQFQSMAKWLALPGILPLYYEDVAFDTVQSATEILQHLGLKFSPDILADIALKERFTQKNKAVPRRYLTEMRPEDSQRIAAEFAPFIEHFITRRADLAPRGKGRQPPPQHLRTHALD